MKRVFRIRGQGKFKEVGHRALVTVPGTAQLESKVAVIQALIPLGLQAMAEILEEEVIALAENVIVESAAIRGGPVEPSERLLLLGGPETPDHASPAPQPVVDTEVLLAQAPRTAGAPPAQMDVDPLLTPSWGAIQLILFGPLHRQHLAAPSQVSRQLLRSVHRGSLARAVGGPP